MRKLQIAILSTFLLGMACNNQKDRDKHSVFRYNQESDISSLDPAFARDQANTWAVNLLFNGLVQLDNRLNIQPAIAHRWEISPDGKTYRFYLRQDVYFHTSKLFGDKKTRKVTASDFVYSFNRLMSPETASPGAWLFNDKVVSDQPFVAENDSVLTIKLQASFPPFLGLLSMQYCSVVPREVVAHYGKDFRDNPIGTGPFTFAFWEPQEALVLHRNPNYFESKNWPYLDAVQISFLPDKQAAFLAFVQGKLDMISGLDPAFKDEILDKNGELQLTYKNRMVLQKSPYLNTEYLGIQMEKKGLNPLQDAQIRRAISIGIDRVKMIKYLRNGIGTAGTAGFIPPGLPGFDSSALSFNAYQPQLARKLVVASGYANNPQPIVLSTTPSYLDLCVFIQKQLQEIGLRVQIETTQGPTLRQLISKSEVPFFRGSWIADYPDAENYLALFYSKNFTPAGPNYTHYSNATFDSVYEAALLENDPLLRAELYKVMDRYIREDAPVIVLYYDQVFRLLQPGISGLPTNPLNLLQLKTVKKAD
jgi:peptide/nickel transport system substrate-binding protein